ncbi:sugar ABC transporter permease [Microbacterium sp. KUDC0406]|uniref:carbohydrate ABC transporter permease n=1 Tax=Microbacterium sp. KUDC0406 TaxID=2909588 RepID=UPI001F3B973E|nr:sugar ABC transporter permease [Microbacterium sp. KUDC0406]UJP08974.1 sugar ABC transporter permease [Microbacterium sp. KUDC0406]
MTTVQSIWLSLNSINALSGATKFVGMENYVNLVTGDRFPLVFTNTVFFVAAFSILNIAVAMGIALLLNNRLRGVNIFRAAVFIPALVTMVAWALVSRFILQPEGLLDFLVSFTGAEEIPWLRSRWLTLTVIVFVQLTKNVGINVLLCLAGLQAVDRELLEAAETDGAGRWARFRHVTIPQVSPTLFMVFLLTVVASFKVFEVILILTNGGPGYETNVLSFMIYDEAFRRHDFGEASALAVILLLMIIVVSSALWAIRKKLVYAEND